MDSGGWNPVRTFHADDSDCCRPTAPSWDGMPGHPVIVSKVSGYGRQDLKSRTLASCVLLFIFVRVGSSGKSTPPLHEGHITRICRVALGAPGST